MPTLIFQDQFTTGGTWNTSNGTPVIVSSPVPPDGGKALECNAIGDYVFWNIPDSGYTRCVWGCWWQCTSFGIATHSFKIDSGTSEGWLSLNDTSGEFFIIATGTPAMSSVFSGVTPLINTWYWLQLMLDVSANPWELRFKVSGTVISTTGAAAASNLDPGIFLLGNTVGGSALTQYYAHAKAGVAVDDNDWWDAPAGATASDDPPMHRLGMSAGW